MIVFRHPEVVARPLAGRPLMLTTYLLRPTSPLFFIVTGNSTVFVTNGR